MAFFAKGLILENPRIVTFWLQILDYCIKRNNYWRSEALAKLRPKFLCSKFEIDIFFWKKDLCRLGVVVFTVFWILRIIWKRSKIYWTFICCTFSVVSEKERLLWLSYKEEEVLETLRDNFSHYCKWKIGFKANQWYVTLRQHFSLLN